MIGEKFNHPSCKVCVCGVSGKGKTTLFAKIVASQKARYKFVFDHQGEFSRRFGEKPCYSIDHIIESTEKGGVICFDPSGEWPGRYPEAFNFFCDYVFNVSIGLPGRKLFVCDEVQKLAFQDVPPELLALIDVSRRRQVDMYFICQSPNQLHNMLRNQFTEVYTFQQNDETAMAYFAKGWNEDEIRNLKPGEWIWKNIDSGQIEKGGKMFRPKRAPVPCR